VNDTNTTQTRLREMPSIDELLRSTTCTVLLDAYGRELVTAVMRDIVAELRAQILAARDSPMPEFGDVVGRAAEKLAAMMAPALKPVFNLTGTVLHTNLGRAPLPAEAIAAMTAVASSASNLEFDLGNGKRGDRDTLVESWICRLTGAEAATVVNNNAAAVLLLLNSLAMRKEVPVSRGELVEIGGAFRIPEVMARAGSKLVEVGTTNRTHARDFEAALSTRTALLMKVHTSNYVVEGFVASVSDQQLAGIAHQHGIAYVVDAGSGSLVDLSQFGLPREQTVAETLSAGADLVTFSGDKLLGGPQCGIIVGRRDLIRKIKKNPMKRALRVDKITLAALTAVLQLYADPTRLAERLPTLRLLTRSEDDIRSVAERLLDPVSKALQGDATVSVTDCRSQIGSGAMPVDLLPSAALALCIVGSRGKALERLAARFRALPVPVIGRIADGMLLLDLRCLENEAGFIEQLSFLSSAGEAP
jgi:L-seryl-tRNA(Ser) seleniumtransferase